MAPSQFFDQRLESGSLSLLLHLRFAGNSHSCVVGCAHFAVPFREILVNGAHTGQVLWAVALGSAASSWGSASMELWLLLIGSIAALHALAVLSSEWSVAIQCFAQYRQVSTLAEASWVRVNPVAHAGSEELVRLQPAVRGSAKEGKAQALLEPHFEYQRQIYPCRSAPGSDGSVSAVTAAPMGYPVGLTIAAYQGSVGLSAEAAGAVRQVFGANSLHIPLPSFRELYIHQLQAPMFVFQTFCMLLYCLDEYWMLSFFTFAMLLILEGTVVKTRLMNLQELRNMRLKPYQCLVYRSRRWQKLGTTQLLPGDLCSVPRSEENRLIPADMLLLAGSCIVNEAMLTGEAIPQMKEPVSGSPDAQIEALQGRLGLHVLYSGTEAVQVTPPQKTDRIRAPDGGCLGYVLRTGFATEQGNLLRNIMSNNQRVSANNREAAIFILCMLLFAIWSAGYVWHKGVAGGRRKVHKLVVECLLIVASVVPPELPIQLSLAVNQSLLQLSKIRITCTEPFRIPFGGKLGVCCFDKTGTLTSDEFVVDGIGGLLADSGDPTALVPVKKITDSHPDTARVLASCHSLVLLQTSSELIGDPLEKATLEAARWAFISGAVLAPSRTKGPQQRITIVTRFHFSSALKRMSTVVNVECVGSGPRLRHMAVCKGAPETVRNMFAELPSGYDATHSAFAQRGSRVLALGYKYLELAKPSDVNRITREETETGLVFAGFLVVSSPIKPDSTEAITNLKQSGHHTVMITGDSPLTACHVANAVGLTASPALTLSENGTGGAKGWNWCQPDGTPVAPYSAGPAEAAKLRKAGHELCLAGPGLTMIETAGELTALLPYIGIYARSTPEQKAVIVGGFSELGYQTLMCGDGTNDVGALKRADVGVALMPPRKKVARKRRSGRQTPEEAMRALQEEMITVPKLGDASIAAPFTSRLSTVMACCNIIRQGRVTLVVSNQMLKILALNCLINAYSMSVLYLEGIKNSDGQRTIVSLIIAGSMFAATLSKPLKKLSPERPRSSIITPYMALNIIGQFAVHLAAMTYLLDVAKALSPIAPFDPADEDDAEEKSEFKVTLVNTVVYLISITMQASTIFTNYHGAPFMNTFWENKWLSRCVLGLWGLALVATAGVWPDLNEFLELAPCDNEVRLTLAAVMVADTVGAHLVDRCCSALFPLDKAEQLKLP